MRLTLTGQNRKILYQRDVEDLDSDLGVDIYIDGTLIVGLDPYYLDPETFAEFHGTGDEVAANVDRYSRHVGVHVPAEPYLMVGVWETDNPEDREWRPVQALSLGDVARLGDMPMREPDNEPVDTGLRYCLDHLAIRNERCDTACRVVPLYVHPDDDPGPLVTD